MSNQASTQRGPSAYSLFKQRSCQHKYMAMAPRRPSGLEPTQKHKYGVIAWLVYSPCVLVLPALVAGTGKRKGARQRLNGALPRLLLPRKRKTASKSKCYHPRHVSLLTQIGQSFYGVQADTEMYHAYAPSYVGIRPVALHPSISQQTADRFPYTHSRYAPVDPK